jgi:protein NEDD1
MHILQKKIKAAADPKGKLTASTSTKPTTQPEPAATTNPTRRPSATKTAPSPARTRARAAAAGSPARPIARKGSTTAGTVVAKGTATGRSAAPHVVEKKVFSPARDPLGNIMGTGDISGMFVLASQMVLDLVSDYMLDFTERIESLNSLGKKTAQNGANPERVDNKEQRPSSRISTTRGTTSRPPSSLVVPLTRTRAGSTASRAESSLSTRRTDRPSSRAESAISNEPSPELPTPCSISAFSSKQASEGRDKRTPSPELPPFPGAEDPVTPVPLAKKRVGLGALGLGTPEVERWIDAGKGKGREVRGKGNGNGKRVGFKEISEDADDDKPSGDDVDNAKDAETQQNLSMQISPRRVPQSWAQTAPHSQAAIPSPLRVLSSSPSSSASAAHNFLRTIIADVMYDYQRETKAEMMGIHLDLVRMGRGLKKELREVAEGGIGGLVEVERLREENRLLKEENERLRRGY